MSDVGAVEEVVASDACDIPQRIGACLGQRGPFAHDEQHAAARGEDAAAVGLRPHVVKGAFHPVEPLDLAALFIGSGIAF